MLCVLCGGGGGGDDDDDEMQAMFCGRILPSLYSFSCGSDFC